MRRALATGLGYAALLAGVALRFDPGSALGTWNSDAAIPVLQSNDPDFDAFRLYYFGQDRFGAWPWLASQAVRALTGFVWTPWRAFLLQAAWACLGAVALCGLHRRAGPVLGATYAALALGSPLLPQELFGLGQPYGWQLTALFFGWGAGKRWLEAMDDLRPPRTVALWGGAAVFWAVLACWTSPVSVPLLLLGGWAEAARLGWLAPARQFRVRWAIWASVPAAVGYAVERELRHLFHRFSLKQFGHAYPTEVRLDVGHLKDNFVAVAAQLGAHPLAPLAGFGVGAALVSAGALAVVRRRGRVSLEVLPAVEAAVTSVSLAAAGLANAAIATAVRHTRMNNYALRYFTPTLVLLTLAAAAGLWALVEWRLRAARREVASWLTAGALLSGALLGAPARLPSPHLKDAERAASGIAGGARALPLLGGYWEVYAVGALDPDRRLLPIPVQWDYQRTPFYLPALRRAEALVYIHLAGAPAPGPWLLQHGGLFRRADAPVQDYGRYRATPYTSVQEAAVAVTLVDPGRAFARCEAPARLAVRWERPLGRGSLFMNYEGAGWQLEPPDGSCRADLVEHSDGLREIRLEECSGVRALVFKDPKPRSPDGGCAAPEAVLVREDVL